MTLIQKARKYLRNCAPAIQSTSGWVMTYSIAHNVKEMGVEDPIECAELLDDEWNATCVPPWTCEELGTLVSAVYTYGLKSTGEALNREEVAAEDKKAQRREIARVVGEALLDSAVCAVLDQYKAEDTLMDLWDKDEPKKPFPWRHPAGNPAEWMGRIAYMVDRAQKKHYGGKIPLKPMDEPILHDFRKIAAACLWAMTSCGTATRQEERDGPRSQQKSLFDIGKDG